MLSYPPPAWLLPFFGAVHSCVPLQRRELLRVNCQERRELLFLAMAGPRTIDRRFISKRSSNQWPPTCLEGWQNEFERRNEVHLPGRAALFLGNADWVADTRWLQEAGIDIVWCAVDEESRYWNQLSERRELFRHRHGTMVKFWSFSPPYHNDVGEEWRFANVLGEFLLGGNRVVVHCAQAEFRGPAAAAWFCMVACGLPFPDAAAIASQHPAQRLSGFNQMVWLQDTVSRHRERPDFRWHRYGRLERRRAALTPQPPAGPPPPERRAAALEAPTAGTAGGAGAAAGAAASGAASEATGGDGTAAADAPMPDVDSEETHLPSPHVLFFLPTRIMHVNVHTLLWFRQLCPRPIPGHFVSHVYSSRNPRRTRSRLRASTCLRT